MATPVFSETGTEFSRPKWDINPLVYYIVAVSLVVFAVWFFWVRHIEVVVPATTTTYEVQPRSTDVDTRPAPAK